MRHWYCPKVAAMVIVLWIIISAYAMSASAWSESDFWTYEVRTTLSEIPVAGSITYRIHGGYDLGFTDAGGFVADVLDVDVFAVSGYFGGNTSSDQLNSSATGVFEGYRHEVRGSSAVVEDELRMTARISEGYETLQEASTYAIWETLSYSPPLMYGIDTVELEVGDSWSQSTDLTRSTTVHSDTDTYNSNETSSVSVTFSVIWSGTESTTAGDFSAIQVQQSCGTVTESYWYAEEAGRFIRYERTEAGQEEPVYVAVLTDYSYDRGPDYTSLTAFLSWLLVVSLAFLAIVIVFGLLRHRGHEVRMTEESRAAGNADKPKGEIVESDTEKKE